MEGCLGQGGFYWRAESDIRIGVGFSPQLASLHILDSCQYCYRSGDERLLTSRQCLKSGSRSPNEACAAPPSNRITATDCHSELAGNLMAAVEV